MRVSLVVAAHNEGGSLGKTVASCVETCADLDYEIVVADDASFDDSISELRQRFPQVRILSSEDRQGASPTKDHGAREASGDVLVFLDGHCKPEAGAIRRLVEGVEQWQGQAILTPAVAALDVERWATSKRQIGHGYFLRLDDFQCGWLPLSQLQPVAEKRRRFYESPALIGCALAVSRELYETLQGFDPDMRQWGVEDLDFGLKCWLMGRRILHDPEAIIAHRFRRSFGNYEVPVEQLVVNQLRMARKNFTESVWNAWLASCRERHQGSLTDHPEGLWARIWELFGERRESVERERSALFAQRRHDEFWYAEKFGLDWPRLQGAAVPGGQASFLLTSLSPSPAPKDPTSPFKPPCECPPQQCCTCSDNDSDDSDTTPCVGLLCPSLDFSSKPIRYFNGEVKLAATDISAGGYDGLWEHRRVYSNQLSSDADLGNGYNWLVETWPYLVEHDDGSITFVRGTKFSLWFDLVGGNYVGRYGAQSTLTHDAGNHEFTVSQPSGEQWTFHDFAQTTDPPGLFARHTAPGLQTTDVTAYTADQRIEAMERSFTAGGVTTTEEFRYEYDDDTGRVLSLTLRHRVGAGVWADILRSQYEYYGGSDANGSDGDLKYVEVQQYDGGWTDIAQSHYRYWKEGDAHGVVHGLKYVVGPAAYARMVADSLNPLTASDNQVSLYADNYFEYDDDRRVMKEIALSGALTFTFDYTLSGNSDDYNHWAVKTVETLPDGDEVTVYTNYIGQVILKQLAAPTGRWCEYHRYDDEAHEILMAEPSAIVGYDDSAADLDVTLRSDNGLIHLTEYYTTSGSGAAPGRLKARKIQQGEDGMEIILEDLEYTERTAGGATVYLVSQQTVYREDDGSGAVETTYGYTYYSGTTQIQQKTTTLPAVPTSQNGSNVSATRKDYFDVNGNLTWTMDERGFINRTVYDIPTGAPTQSVQDVDTSLTTDEPSGWVTPVGGGLNLITDLEHDDRGRITQVLGPSHQIDLGGSATTIRRAMWMNYLETASTRENRTGQGYATGSGPSYTYTLVNPVSITITDVAGKVQQQIQATRASTSGKLSPSDTFAQSSYTRWTTLQYTDCCHVASQRVYHTIPSSGTGSSGTNYDQTDYGYDVMKRRNRVVTPGGTITRWVFDARGLVVSIWVGTDDTGATSSDPTGGGASGNNMVIITANVYDGGNSGGWSGLTADQWSALTADQWAALEVGPSGDGNLTQQTQYAAASDTRVTSFTYDWRNRRTAINGEVDFYQQNYFDNLNRVVKTERYNTTSGGNLIAKSETLYDDRGRIYRTIRYAVTPSTGAIGNSLTDNTWFDAAGNVIKSLPSGSQLFTKFVYDSLGRRTTQYLGYDLDETSYADADDVTGDTILEQSETDYDDASNVIQSTAKQRYHNAPANQTGALGDPSTNPKARVTYVAQYPDALGRGQATANYGTNGGSALSRSSTIPTRSDTILVTSQAYDDAGNLESTTDPAAMTVGMEYDDLGRETSKILNEGGSSPSSLCTDSDDVDVTVHTAYNADGNVASITAVNSVTGNQTTEYVYGTTLSDSDVASSLLKRKEIYPDSVDSSDVILFAYNRQSQVKQLTDQQGTVHAYDFDKLGRQTQDRITTLGSGVDSAVRRIASTYEVRGMRTKATSYNNATVGSGSVVNETQFTYNDFAQLTADYQAHGGAVNTSTSPKVQYGYADGSANTIRPTTLTYPDGRVLHDDYGDPNGIADAASRVASLIDGATTLVNYSYLGAGVFVEQNNVEPDLKWTMIDLSGTNDPDTGDIYSGFDRFGRVKDNRWYDYGSSVDVDRVKYGYDRASNRIWRQNPVATALSKAFDELYTNDGVQRLKDMQRGTLNGTHTALTTTTFAQCWTLDPTGNWQGFRQDDDGGGTWDLDQARTANTVNEITNITETAGASWVTPAYNRAGNMTTMPKPAAPTGSYTATYDAWNRLVKLVDGANTVSEYQYDGMKRRIAQKTYTAGTLSETRHLYYTQPGQWQVIEERLGTSPDSANPVSQTVWGLRYIDDCLLRDRDTNGDGTLNERLYALQDANWNVTSLADTSGAIQERYAYTAYGVPSCLTPTFTPRASSNYAWDTLYCGYRYEPATGLYHVRHRVLHPVLGTWAQRDPMGYVDGMSQYHVYFVLAATDPAGLRVFWCARDLAGSPLGNHTFLLLLPDVPGDFPGEVWRYMGNGMQGKTIGGFEGESSHGEIPGCLTIRYNDQNDVRSIMEMNGENFRGPIGRYLLPDFDAECHEVALPNGVGSDSDFIRLLLTDSRNIKPYCECNVKYSLANRNCSTMSNLLLKRAGVCQQDREQLGEFWGTDWGEEDEFPLPTLILKESDVKIRLPSLRSVRR